MVELVAEVPGATTYVLGEGQQASPDFAPRAYVDLDESETLRVIRAMREGEPPVVVRSSGSGIVVDPMTLTPGDEEIVGRRLKEELGR